MRILLYFIALLLALPQIALCAVFSLLFHLTDAGSLGGFFMRALDVLVALLSWRGAVLLGAFLVLLALGFSSRFRWIGLVALTLLLVASTSILLWLVGRSLQIDQLWTFLPGAVALAIAVRLLALDAPRRLSAAV